MASWTLVPCLVQLRTELNMIAPGRDTSSDGTIGDAAHRLTVSDHNDDEVGRVPIKDADSKHEVHAFDADADLRTPNLTMEMVVQHILGRCRSGAEKRLRYMIFDRRIWEASNGWRQRTYTGSSPHVEHAHFSASYVTAREADMSSWRLEDIPVALTDADKRWLAAQIDAAATNAAERVWETRKDVNVGYKDKNPDGSVRPASMQRLDDIVTHGSPERHQIKDMIGAVGDQVEALAAKVEDLAGKLEGQA